MLIRNCLSRSHGNGSVIVQDLYINFYPTYIWSLNDLLQWSFGVTCWEVFTAGKIPYAGADPLTLTRLLEDGRRLEKPSNTACSVEM